MRRILTSATLTLALALPLAGCGDDPAPSPTPSASTSPATASPSPTGPVAPVLPAAAKANTEAGAKAFVRYWFEAVTYAMQTGDTGPIDAVAHESCGACSNVHDSVDRIYLAKQRVAGGGWNPTEITLDPQSKAPSYRFAVRVEQPAQQLIDENGKTVDQTKATVFVFRTGATWQDDHFMIYGLEKIA